MDHHQQQQQKVHIEKAQNFMRQYRDPESRELKKLSANQFMDVWSHYDGDGNGYIEGTELDGFLKEFVSSANATDLGPESLTDEMLVELKSCFMEAYDDNQDGKIDIRELAQLLPMEENFLLLFRFDNPLESSVEFMKIWREYDSDNSGYIEADELKNFLRDLLKEAKKINDVSEDKLIEYTDTMLRVFDANKDGRLQLSEMAKLLPVKENFLCRQVFKEGRIDEEGAARLTKDDIEKVFSLYDRDNNGSIENEELRGFLKDLLELVKKDYDAQDLIEFEETIMRGVGYDKEGKISRKELTMILLALAKQPPEDEQSYGECTSLVSHPPAPPLSWSSSSSSLQRSSSSSHHHRRLSRAASLTAALAVHPITKLRTLLGLGHQHQQHGNGSSNGNGPHRSPQQQQQQPQPQLETPASSSLPNVVESPVAEAAPSSSEHHQQQQQLLPVVVVHDRVRDFYRRIMRRGRKE